MLSFPKILSLLALLWIVWRVFRAIDIRKARIDNEKSQNDGSTQNRDAQNRDAQNRNSVELKECSICKAWAAENCGRNDCPH